MGCEYEVQTVLTSPYVDWEFYSETYGGLEVEEERFAQIEARAEAFIDSITFGRIPKYPADAMTDSIARCVRMAVCAAMESMAVSGEGMVASATTSGISSESNDGYSVSYGRVDASEARQVTYQAAYDYLACTGLLARCVGRKRPWGSSSSHP